MCLLSETSHVLTKTLIAPVYVFMNRVNSVKQRLLAELFGLRFEVRFLRYCLCETLRRHLITPIVKRCHKPCQKVFNRQGRMNPLSLTKEEWYPNQWPNEVLKEAIICLHELHLSLYCQTAHRIFKFHHRLHSFLNFNTGIFLSVPLLIQWRRFVRRWTETLTIHRKERGCHQ
jgi:hypothetical protein